MLHPSYQDLIEVTNENVAEGEEPIVGSRYSIILAAAKRARQLVDGAEPLVLAPVDKPLSIAVEELYRGEVHILRPDEVAVEEKTAYSYQEKDYSWAQDEETEESENALWEDEEPTLGEESEEETEDEEPEEE